MANSDKNIVITPNVGQSADPQIVFSGADASTAAQNITLKVYATNNGTLSFEGSQGQLFSIANTMSGTIFSANDISGIPSIEVLDTGLVKLAQYGGNVLLGSGTDDGTAKLQISGGGIKVTATGSTTTPTISLNGTTNNWISWNQNGVAAPAFTTRSAGTKLVLYPNVSGATVDYAIGIEGNTSWSSIPAANSSYAFKWYAGTTNIVTLNGAGTLTVTGPIVSSSSAPADSTAFAISQHRVQSNTTLHINADTDASTTEYVLLTAGHPTASSTSANGLAVGFNSLTWKNDTVATLTATQTFTNKTLTAPTISGAGTIGIARDGTTNDPYAPINVTRGTTGANAYYGLVRNSQVPWQLGIDTDNGFIVGTGNGGGVDQVVVNKFLKLSGSGNLSVTGSITAATGEVSSYFRITAPNSEQRLLIGNQDSGGTNLPAIIASANGTLFFGNGDTWTGNGGTNSTYASFNSGGANFSTSVTARGTLSMVSSSIVGNPTLFSAQDQSGATVVEIGRTDGTSANAMLDFHTGATSTDFDVRMVASGGNGSSAGGTLNIQAANLQWGGTNLARVDGTGASGNWSINISGTASVASNVTVTNDTTTNTTYYPMFSTATSGNVGTKVSSSRLTFNPGTGAMSVGGILTVGSTITNASNYLTIANPGIGYANGFIFSRGTDSAGITVIETANDQLMYELTYSDNVESTVDMFQIRMDDWQSVNGLYVSTHVAGQQIRLNGTSLNVWAPISQRTSNWFTTSNTGATGGADKQQIFNDVSKLRIIGSTTNITALNVAGYSGTSGAHIWIKVDAGGTTFSWGYNSPSVSPVAVQTGLALSTSAVALSNGIQVTFSAATGTAGDTWTFRAYKTATNTLGNTSVTGSLTVSTAIDATSGGTSQSTYATGDMLYASAANTLAKRAIGTDKQTLVVSSGVPTWATLDLTYMPDAWVKKAVVAATTASLAITARTATTLTIGGTTFALDGITLANGDRVLVKNNTTGTGAGAHDNGIYQVSGVGSSIVLTRVAGADTAAELAGATVNIDQGSTQGGQIWTTYFKTTDTIGTSAVNWYRVYTTNDSVVLTTGAQTLSSKTLTAPQLNAPTFGTSASITAGTNAQGQGALTSDFNVITTAANAPSGVTLPTATVGRIVTIVNRGANTVNVYPATGATIDALAANASTALIAGAKATFQAKSTTAWELISTPGATGYTGSIGYTGSKGDTGYNGSVGATGYTGSMGATAIAGAYVHTQGAASSTWTIVHNLGVRYVNVEVINSSNVSLNGTYDYPTVTFTDVNTVTLTFTTATAGYAAVTSGGGAQGPIGFTGSQGVIGYTGSKGDIGYTGSKGDIGATGYTGSQGVQGVIGYTGSKGDQGVIGYTGSKGDQGNIGYTGSQGTQGVIGYTGSQGVQGVIGYTGSQGVQGVIGYTGSQGAQGVIGYTGSQGAQGVIGYTGSKGDVGYTGSQGAIGYTGSLGASSGVALTFSTTVTDADPGNGVIRFNNATIASVTQVFIDDLDAFGNNITAWVDTLDDSTTSVEGFLYIRGNTSGSTTLVILRVTGAVVSATGYKKVPVAYVSGSLPANSQVLSVVFARTGDVGYTGSKGDVGFTGSQGAQGVIGYTGSQGAQGVIGYTGSQGAQGVIGYTGSQGSQGVIGYTGSQGAQGVTGYTGSKGDQGNIGYTGSQGATAIGGGFVHTQSVAATTWTVNHNLGQRYVNVEVINSSNNSLNGTYDYPTVNFVSTTQLTLTFTSATAGYAAVTSGGGQQGPTGYNGSVGSQGPIGYTGSQGVGYTGSKGDIGSTGYTGSQGAQGPIGYTGSQGAQGPIGYTGSNNLAGGTFTGHITGATQSLNMLLNEQTALGSFTARASGTGDANLAGITFYNDAYAIKLGVRADGTFGLGGWSRSAWSWYSDGSGNMVAAGNVTGYSDPRLKENVSKIDDPFAILNKIDGVTFTWKNGIVHTQVKAGKKDYGILADQVESVMPEIVTDSIDIEGEKYKTVSYEKLVPVLIESIKQLEARIAELEAKKDNK